MALVETSGIPGSYTVATGGGISSSQSDQLWQSLLQPTFNIPPVTTPLRAASICMDGTPVVFSVKLTHEQEAPAFRVLVEPGGTGITVPQQVSCSLKAADELLQIMGWQQAAEQVNSIIREVFPSNSAELENWWGGIWLGTSIAESHTELRLYLNLRHGNMLQRWQRVVNVLTIFSDESIGPVLEKLILQSSPHAIPVGLGIVINKTVRGIRLYAGMQDPNEKSIMDCISGNASLVKDEIHWFCQQIEQQFGSFTRQSVTLGYDFHLDKTGILQPLISRTKIDVACQRFAKAEGFLPFLHQLVQRFQFDNSHLPSFLADLRYSFSGYDVEYISLGVDDGIDHLTVYAKPHSLQPAGSN
jgi:hypothetical protein